MNIRKLSLAVAFTLALALPAFAGDISTGVVSPPPTPITTDGDISTGVTSQTDTSGVAGDIHTTAQASDSIIEMALSVVQSVLSLF